MSTQARFETARAHMLRSGGQDLTVRASRWSAGHDLVAERGRGRGDIVGADHRVELIVEDPHRKEDLEVYVRLDKRAESGRAGAGNILQPYGHCLPLDVVDLGRPQRVAGGVLIVSDECHGAAVAMREPAHDKVDASRREDLA